MRHLKLVPGMILGIAAVALLGLRPAQPKAASQTAIAPVQMVVTVNANRGSEVPAVRREDVMVYQGRDRDEVKDWIPLQADESRLELFLLLDDASRETLGAKLEDLRTFINAQSPVTAIGLGYMHDGVVDIVSRFTTDHAKVAGLIRPALGAVGASANPYLSIVSMIKRWPTDSPGHKVLTNGWPEVPVRHEILVISDGIDRSGGIGPNNPFVDAAIVEAQSTGVVIYTIFALGVGRYGRSIWRINWGQNYLSQVAEETGGEAFYLRSETAVSFAPFLEDVDRRLSHQYLLAFFARPEKKAGLQRIKLRTEIPNAELVGAEKVYVPAAL
jgi:hypothetical protein